jgi:hypothetical protein
MSGGMRKLIPQAKFAPDAKVIGEAFRAVFVIEVSFDIDEILDAHSGLSLKDSDPFRIAREHHGRRQTRAEILNDVGRIVQWGGYGIGAGPTMKWFA